MATAQQLSTTLDISGMTCASCVRRVERSLAKVPGVETANVNFASETAYVTTDGSVTVDALVGAVEHAGYGARASDGLDRAAERDEASRHTLMMLVFGAVLGVPVVLLSMAMDIADMYPDGNERLSMWIVLILATPVQIVLGWRYYRGAFVSLRHLNPNMDVLIALGTSVAYLFSAWVVVFDQSYDMFLDVSVAVLLFITMGKYFEERARGSSMSAVRSLLKLSATSARLWRDGSESEVPVEAVRPGDLMIVREGERVPVDGVIREGHGTIDESMITGESIPAERRPGEQVIGGTVNQSGVMRIEATAVGSDTVLAQMARLIEEAQGSKAPIQHLVDRVAAVFVPAVILVALVTFLAWGLIGSPAGGDQSAWLTGMRAAVAVLVIACPCALGLATPTAIVAGTGVGAERGILIRNAEVLEAAGRIDTVVADKTGTLTEGRPQVSEIVAMAGRSETELLALTAAAEQDSTHPLSRAVVDAAVESGRELAPADSFESLTALGVRATVEGAAVVAGNRRLLADSGIAIAMDADERASALEGGGRTVIFVAVDGELAGLIGIADAVKANSSRAVQALGDLGTTVIMATGDNERAARRVASAIGIAEVRAGARPEDKIELLRELQGAGHVVAMVGDGVNDAPALAQADVGIAMSTGAAIAMEASDITLLHGDISKVAEAIALSRETLTTIKQNLGWAFGYNIVAIPIAALGLLNPVIAGAAMAFSSVSVMTNSLRLRGKARRIAERSGNAYAPAERRGTFEDTGPALALGAAGLILIVPLVVFTGISRGWIG